MFKKINFLILILISVFSSLNISNINLISNIFSPTVLAENKQLNNKVGKFILSYQPTNESSNYKFRIKENKIVKHSPIEHNKIKQFLEETAIFDDIIDQLNRSGLVMRQDIPVIFKDCGTPNAYWNAKDKNIIICYENMAYDLALFKILGNYDSQTVLEKSINETIFAFYHELGHALIDVLPLAAVGQEEDTVDEFASITLLKNKDSNNDQIVLDGAEFYKLKNGQPRWWDEHTPDLKRVFNIVCFVYGSNPQKYEEEFIETFLFVNAQGNKVSKEIIERRG